jgi:hypothetical protein
LRGNLGETICRLRIQGKANLPETVSQAKHLFYK